jgi:hypothetical protein
VTSGEQAALAVGEGGREDGGEAEGDLFEVRPAEFAGPMQITQVSVVQPGGQVAVHFGDETAAAAREQLLGTGGVLRRMA